MQFTWKIVMTMLLVHDNSWQRVDGEMSIGHINRRCVKESVRLKMLCDRMIRVPQKTFLLANKRKEYRIVRLEHINAFGSCDLLYWWSRHSCRVRQEFLFRTISIVNELLMTFDTAEQ